MKSLFGFVFPGQGSQSIGMLSDVASHFSEIESTFSEASAVLGYDLWDLVSSGPSETLDITTHTQPALLTASYALWRIIQNKLNDQPAVFAGHSLGEYTALVCSNSISFTDAVKIVAARGQFMQDAVPVGQGGLAAIVGLDDLAVAKLCETAISEFPNEILSPVNFNSPGQVVVGGSLDAIHRVINLSKEMGARLAKLLPVSVPSHCVLMKPAAHRLQAMLENIAINSPQIPVINNVDVAAYTTAESIRDGLTRQLFMPVRWVEVIQAFEKMGIQSIVECGPGKVLTGLNKRITNKIELNNVSDLTSLESLFCHQ